MSHNPILKQLNLGRLERFTVEKDTVAVLFKNQRFEREAGPGERIGYVQAMVVDTSPRTLVWRAELPSIHPNDFFSCTFTLRYSVDDARRMVADSITDTEALLARLLEQKLRPKTRAYALNHQAELEPVVVELLDNLDLPGLCGLRFLELPDVLFDFSETARARIKELDRIEKAMRLPQSASHFDDVPSKEPEVGFRVQVAVQYRVANPDDLPYETLAEAEQQLWPRMQRALRKASRQYAVDEIAAAETAMQEALDDVMDDDKAHGFGLHLLAANVTADLDETARKRYAELANIKHANAMEQVRRSGLQENTDFFTGLIRQGSWAVLAVAVSKGEISVETLYQRMSQAEQQRLAMQIDLLKTLREDNSRDEAQDWQISQDLLKAVADQALRPTTPGLPETAPTKQLTDGRSEDQES
jgi:hypothetical protein